MKIYHFETLMGTVYRQGNLTFLPKKEDSTLLSPVGNRISLYDLKRNHARTLSVEGNHNYTAIDVSPNGRLLLAGNEIGEVHVISLVSTTLLHCLNIGKRANIVKFSPDGSQFAVSKENTVFIYRAPSLLKSFNPFLMERVYHDATADITSVCYSFDSKLVAIASRDMIIRVYAINKVGDKSIKPAAISGHSDIIINAFFVSDSYNIISIGRNRQFTEWTSSWKPTKSAEDLEDGIAQERNYESSLEIDVPGEKTYIPLRYSKTTSRYLEELDGSKNISKAPVTCADYCKKLGILVTGYEDAVFRIHSLQNVELITSLSLSDTTHSITTVCFNEAGDWIALGSTTLGQLLVWDWKNEVYILKQQGHFNTMMVCAYSSDGRHIVTGGQDGKVKVWESRTSFCFVTFDEHTSSVTGVAFTQNGNAILSSSMDGTVRAFDLTRYRNFRTFTTPKPAQFSCVTVDASREFVAAGASDVFDIFLWSMKTGKLLEVLGGHEGPVNSVLFNPSGGTELASVSWDKTLRVWEAVESSGSREVVLLKGEGTCLAYRPDGEEVAVGTSDGQIIFYSPKLDQPKGSIEGRHHLGSGILETDRVTAKTNLAAKYFTTINYSPDGCYLMAAGASKTICYYDASRQVLVKKYHITQNKSLDGMNEFIHHKNVTEFGNKSLINDDDDVTQDKLSLPGVRMGDKSSRTVRPEVRVTSVSFSPSGMQWIATSTEGLFLYSAENSSLFIPISANENITPAAIYSALQEKEFDKAVVIALHLNMEDKIREVLEKTPRECINAVCRSISPDYAELFIKFLAQEIGTSRHFHFYTLWANYYLRAHLKELKSRSHNLTSMLNLLAKNMTDKRHDVLQMAIRNRYTIDFLIKTADLEPKESKDKESVEEEQERMDFATDDDTTSDAD